MSITYIEGNTNPEGVKIGIVVSRWNSSITERMLQGALKALKGNGIMETDIIVSRCPGSFELPLAVKSMLDSKPVDGIIALGVVIRGGTPHFEYVCDAVTRGIMDINLASKKPVAFGVLTTDDVKQAIERVGDKGNKGGEAALAVLEMISLQQKLNN
ncbi:MAG: 6,7-dimethyl-8-ribityllumazine synthase [Balneola sp.]|mgnify:CR=1 FL=1|jgi:6,7-dimethyl-8-ribityllumazine synthase|tara:strand:+ start:16266 stop:16736 length:471 start_codon:yes stop_codon:yes gene_type:complete